MVNEKRSFGKLLRTYRKRANISQLDFEKKTGLPIGSLNKFEIDLLVPDDRTIQRIAKLLKLSHEETALLKNVDVDYVLKIMRLQSELLMLAGDRDKVFEKACDGMLDILDLVGAGIFLLDGNKLRFEVISSNSIVDRVIDSMPFTLNEMYFDLDKDKNDILDVFRSKSPKVVENARNLIKPWLGDKAILVPQKIAAPEFI